METFAQLLDPKTGMLGAASISVKDAPDYAWRYGVSNVIPVAHSEKFFIKFNLESNVTTKRPKKPQKKQYNFELQKQAHQHNTQWLEFAQLKIYSTTFLVVRMPMITLTCAFFFLCRRHIY